MHYITVLFTKCFIYIQLNNKLEHAPNAMYRLRVKRSIHCLVLRTETHFFHILKFKLCAKRSKLSGKKTNEGKINNYCFCSSSKPRTQVEFHKTLRVFKIYTEFIRPGASIDSRHFRTGQKKYF